MATPEGLRAFGILKWASADTLSVIAAVAKDEEFAAGEQLFAAGADAAQLFVVCEGTIDIECLTATGERQVVDSVGVGEIVGWSAVIKPYKMTAYAVARTACKTVSVDALRLRQLIAEDVAFADTLMAEIAQVTARRLHGARAQITRLK